MRGQFLLAFRYLTGRKTRLVLTTLAIVFGVMVLFGMNSMLPGVMNAFRHTMISAAGTVDITVSSSSNNTFDQEVFSTISAVEGVSAATGSLQRTVQIPARLGGTTDPITGSAAITLTGLDLATATSVRSYQVDEGRFLQEGDQYAAVVGYNLAQKMNLSVGDPVTLPSALGTAELEIVGISSQFQGGTTDEVYVPLATAQEILNLPGRLSAVDLLIYAGEDKAAVEAELIRSLGSQFKIGAVLVGSELNAALDLGQNMMWLMGIMALAMAAFIIFNTFRTVVAERRRDLGMLRAVGASKRTVMQLIITESVIQGVIGTALGLAAGYLLAWGMLKAMSPLLQTFMRIELGTPMITSQNLIASILLGIGFTVGSAYFPARQAMKVTPLEALRPPSQVVERRSTRRRAVSGLVLTAVGVVALIFGELQVASFGTLLLLVGTVLLVPVAVRPVANTFGALISRLYARQGNLAQGNLNRQPGRAAVTASAMLIGIAVTIAMLGMVTSVSDGFTSYLDKSLGADYLFMPDSLVLGSGNLGAAPEFAARLENIEGVSGVTSLRLAASQANDAALQVIGIDPLKYPEISGLEFSKGDPDSAYTALASDRAIVVNGIFSTSSGIKVGDVVKLNTPQGALDYKVVGIAMDYLNAKLATGYISQANLEQDFNVTTDVLIMANRASGADEKAVNSALRAAVVDYPAFTLLDSAKFKQEQLSTLNLAMSFMYLLVLMLAIPGLIAMVNTLSINVIERTREIGMLRAIGSTRKQVKQMVFSESLLLSALGTSLGILVGLFLSYYLVKALVFSGFELKFFFPGYGVLTAIGVGLLFGVLAAMIPARQAAATPIVEALRYE
jgi:putative ABC transport system permease protein